MKLTATQEYVIAELHRRGAHWTAEATEREWRAGRRYYLDSRNAAGIGLRRIYNKANNQVQKMEDTPC